MWTGALAGFVAMTVIAFFQIRGAGVSGAEGSSWLMLLVAGVVGAGAMILPGISGGYMLLVLGQYVVILGGIEAFKDALKAGDLAAAIGPALSVLLPVGLGVLVGVIGVSNLLKLLFARYEKPTLGVLLGLLIGAVMGLWPFQRAVPPQLGDLIKGQVVTAETLAAIKPEHWLTQFFTPTAGQVTAALGLVIAGFLLTALIARLGREKNSADNPDAARG